MLSEHPRTAPQRYASGWLSPDRVEPLIALPAQRQIGATTVVSPLSDAQRQLVLDLLGAAAHVRRQAAHAVELRVTRRRHGYFVALGPLDDAP